MVCFCFAENDIHNSMEPLQYIVNDPMQIVSLLRNFKSVPCLKRETSLFNSKTEDGRRGLPNYFIGVDFLAPQSIDKRSRLILF